jgi:hypothetical protein
MFPSSALKEQTARSEHLKSFSRHCLYDSTQTSAITFAAPRAGDVPATTQRAIDSDASWLPHTHTELENTALTLSSTAAQIACSRVALPSHNGASTTGSFRVFREK